MKRCFLAKTTYKQSQNIPKIEVIMLSKLMKCLFILEASSAKWKIFKHVIHQFRRQYQIHSVYKWKN